MTTNPSIVDEAESLLRTLANQIVRVLPGECLCCYMWRQLDQSPCDGSHRLALHFRDTTAPRATALLERLSQLGGCCCDCELFQNGYQPRLELWTPRRLVADGDTFHEVDPEPVNPLPPCGGVRRGSTRPCAHWRRVRYWR